MTKETEATKRALYDALAAIRKDKKHPKKTDALETALELHLEAVRLEFAEGITRLAAMTQERDDALQRMYAVDHAHNNLDQANKIAGEEIERLRLVATQNLDGWRSAQKRADDLEQLTIAQRLAIADLYMKRAAK